METFRISREKYATTLSGSGAAIRGARWNSAGVEIIYTSANRSLAMAEVAVHLNLSTLQNDYVMLTIYLPDDIEIQKLSDKALPSDWNSFPHDPATRKIGDRFIADGKYCILRVPSAVTKGDHNFLINPHHAEFDRIRITSLDKFPFDERIFR
ncbi:MAG: RES family NAD+ phosphorylase [Pyrinomonadaceae bacterium]